LFLEGDVIIEILPVADPFDLRAGEGFQNRLSDIGAWDAVHQPNKVLRCPDLDGPTVSPNLRFLFGTTDDRDHGPVVSENFKRPRCQRLMTGSARRFFDCPPSSLHRPGVIANVADRPVPNSAVEFLPLPIELLPQWKIGQPLQSPLAPPGLDIAGDLVDLFHQRHRFPIGPLRHRDWRRRRAIRKVRLLFIGCSLHFGGRLSGRGTTDSTHIKILPGANNASRISEHCVSDAISIDSIDEIAWASMVAMMRKIFIIPTAPLPACLVARSLGHKLRLLRPRP
jgi:hypothetical protein